jgi:hypothetical protein
MRKSSGVSAFFFTFTFLKVWLLCQSWFYHVKKPCYLNSYMQYGFTFILHQEGLQKPSFAQWSLAVDIWSCSILKNTCRLFTFRMLKMQKLYSKSSKHYLKQEAHSSIMDLLPKRSYHWRKLTGYGIKDHQWKKRHIITEAEVKQQAMEMAKLMCGKDAELKIVQIPLSHNTIHDWFKDMLEHICIQMVRQTKGSLKKK